MIRVAFLGNPNTGKTTLFNRVCGLRHKTSNYAGTTQEARLGRPKDVEGLPPTEIIDLPGVYSLELDQSESEICRRVLAGDLAPEGELARAPDVVCVVADATNLGRNFLMLGEALRRRLPTVLVLNMCDMAGRMGVEIDAPGLSRELGCPVVRVCARSGEGCEAMPRAMAEARVSRTTPPGSVEGLEAWADAMCRAHVKRVGEGRDRMTDRLDRVFTHPVLGLLVFGLVMSGVFYGIFTVAA
ncbi:MAG: FeoB small GTPase domain-containing protein, partial [Phycisphaerales bacterium]